MISPDGWAQHATAAHPQPVVWLVNGQLPLFRRRSPAFVVKVRRGTFRPQECDHQPREYANGRTTIVRTSRAGENRPQTFGRLRKKKMASFGSLCNGCATIGILQPSQSNVPDFARDATVREIEA
jgi:hypothetical protein